MALDPALIETAYNAIADVDTQIATYNAELVTLAARNVEINQQLTFLGKQRLVLIENCITQVGDALKQPDSPAPS